MIDKTRLDKIISQKPISKTQNRWRIGLLVGGMLVSLFLASFCLALIIFDGNDYGKNGIAPRELHKMERLQSKPEKRMKSPNLQNQLEIVALEFIIFTIIFVFLAVFLYRTTDWKFVKYPKLLILMCLILVFLLSLVIFGIFQQNNSAPRFIRQQRFGQMR